MILDSKIITFIKVCELQSYTAAAEALNMTQPAVSQQIRYLEREFGHQLIHYERKQMSLTPEGELLYRKARVISTDTALIKEQMDDMENGKRAYRFGVTMTVGEFVIARPLAEFSKAHSALDIRMEIANTQTLESKLRSGELSFAIVEGNFDKKEFDWELFSTVPFVAAAAANHQFKKPVSRFADLLDETILVREPGSGTRNILESYMTANNYSLDEFHGRIQIGGMHTLLRMLSEDSGISFMYKTAVRHMLSHGTLQLIPLKDFQISHDFCLIWPKGSVYAEEYRNICRELRDLSEKEEK